MKKHAKSINVFSVVKNCNLIEDLVHDGTLS